VPPLYEYECDACSAAWNDLQKVSDPPTEACPVCTAKSARRIVSASHFVLKGPGWAADHYSKTAKDLT
jgi:putative FmdB family regulatory protein